MFETMLIVDDQKVEREMLRDLLQTSFSIIEAENGEECLECVEDNVGDIDVILLDLQMPVMDGFEVLKKRMENSRFQRIPVIVLTASGATNDQIEAFRLGASDFISKPLDIGIMISRINNVLQAQRRTLGIMKNKEEEVFDFSKVDPMTGLYDKEMFVEVTRECIEKYPHLQHALMLIDIDDFEMINNVEGHMVGDHTIRIIADLISTYFRNSDIVGRVGGDRFAVLMVDVPTKTIARRKAKDIVRMMKYKPNLTIPVNVSLSIGLAFSEHEETTYEVMERKAQMALYRSKNDGKAKMSEFGMESQFETNTNKRKKAMLYSFNRTTEQMIETSLDDKLELSIYSNIEYLKKDFNENHERIQILYVDVEGESDAGEAVWEEIRKLPLLNTKVITLCEEGNMSQYREALEYDFVEDIISIPMDKEGLRRRTERYFA